MPQRPRRIGIALALFNSPPPAGKRIDWLFVTSGEIGRDRHPPYRTDLVKAVQQQNAKK